MHTKELHSFRTTLHTARYEIENEIVTKLDEKLRERDLDQAELHAFKSEVYDYMQSKIKQLTKAYSPKINLLYK